MTDTQNAPINPDADKNSSLRCYITNHKTFSMLYHINLTGKGEKKMFYENDLQHLGGGKANKWTEKIKVWTSIIQFVSWKTT